MSYSQVSHIAHDSYPPQGPAPAGVFQAPPPPPPRPGFEQGYGGPPPGYQGYFLRDDYPPSSTRIHHTLPFQSYDYPSYDNPCSSFLRACMAVLCCCCLMEECCPRW